MTTGGEQAYPDYIGRNQKAWSDRDSDYAATMHAKWGRRSSLGDLGQVRYDKVASWATCRVSIREEALDQLLTDSSALLAAQTNDPDRERGATWTFAPRPDPFRKD
jgi:hypothetical protein